MFISGNGRRRFFPVSIPAFDTHLAFYSVCDVGCLHANFGDWGVEAHIRVMRSWKLAGAKPLLPPCLTGVNFTSTLCVRSIA